MTDMQSDNNKSNGKSHLHQSVFSKSLAGVLMLGGLAIGANRGSTVPAIPPELKIATESLQPRTAVSVTSDILQQTLPEQADQVRNGQLTSVDQSASFVLAVKR